jgi:hypothetical protein
MIALLVGHTKEAPGRKVNHLAHNERYYNRMVADVVSDTWRNNKFFQGIVIDCPIASEKTGINDRIKATRKIDGLKCALEIHHNSTSNPRINQNLALTFFQKGSQVSRDLSSYLNTQLMPFLKPYDIKQWLEVGLPSTNWGTKGSVEHAPYPCVLLEPCFMTNKESGGYFNLADIYNFSIQLAVVLENFYKENF